MNMCFVIIQCAMVETSVCTAKNGACASRLCGWGVKGGLHLNMRGSGFMSGVV